MPRKMNQHSPEAFRLVAERTRTYEGNTFESTTYYGPYATAAACKGQIRRATDELNWSRSANTVLKFSIERTVSHWEKVE
jgi:hypothetical protein